MCCRTGDDGARNGSMYFAKCAFCGASQIRSISSMTGTFPSRKNSMIECWEISILLVTHKFFLPLLRNCRSKSRFKGHRVTNEGDTLDMNGFFATVGCCRCFIAAAAAAAA